MIIPIFATFYVGASIVSLAIGFYYSSILRPPVSRTVLAMFSAGALWLFTYAAELWGPGIDAKIFANKLQFVGSLALLIGVGIFVLQILNLGKWVTSRNIIIACAVPVISLVMVFTNQFHHLVWPYHSMEVVYGWAMLDHPHGPMYYIITTYSELILIGITALLLVSAFQSKHLFRRQALVMLYGLLLPWGVQLISVFGLNIWTPINFSPLVFVASIGFMVVGISRLHVGDILPVAHTTILETMADAVLVLDERQLLLDANPAARKLLTTTENQSQDIVGLPLAAIHLQWANLLGQNFVRAETTRQIEISQNGTKYIYDVHISPLAQARGALGGNVIVLQDVTKQTLAAGQLQESLTEKEVLLKEIHHRVKNNLQIISSLLFLQSRNADNEVVQESLTESQNRVRSMALVHEQLYQSTDLAKIDFIKYVRVLVSNLQQAFGAKARNIHAVVQGESIHFDIDTAIPCGLILNELISNAFKYAYPNGNRGEISVVIEAIADDKIRLRVSDNGIGLPDDFHTANQTSLGVTLVRSLSVQLKGEARFTGTDNGTTVDVIFPQNH